MPAILPFLSTQDNYVSALQLGPFTNGREVGFIVSKASVWFQLAFAGKDGQMHWGSELPTSPTSTGYETCGGIRFRSYNPGSPATVLAFLYFDTDPVPLGGSEYDTILVAIP